MVSLTFLERDTLCRMLMWHSRYSQSASVVTRVVEAIGHCHGRVPIRTRKNIKRKQ